MISKLKVIWDYKDKVKDIKVYELDIPNNILRIWIKMVNCYEKNALENKSILQSSNIDDDVKKTLVIS